MNTCTNCSHPLIKVHPSLVRDGSEYRHKGGYNHSKRCECREADPEKNPAAVALGSIKSKKKAKTSAENGKKGGRPRTKRLEKNNQTPQ